MMTSYPETPLGETGATGIPNNDGAWAGIGNGEGLRRPPLDKKRLQEAGQKFKTAAESRHQGTAGQGARDSHCLVMVGEFSSEIADCLRRVCEKKKLPYPGDNKQQKGCQLNLILDSPGGSMDEAYKFMLYLRRYADNITVFIPRKAKSASTLIALGADKLVMSPFAELGPLDTQVNDPRNPNEKVSALDCYRSVSYVSSFGEDTILHTLETLTGRLGRRLLMTDSLQTALSFSIGNIQPIMQQVTPLSLGHWVRSLRIGERYARMLLERTKPGIQSDRIAKNLVYNYTHHTFPIDFMEADAMGLEANLMTKDEYHRSWDVVDACGGHPYIDFIDGLNGDDSARNRSSDVNGAEDPSGYVNPEDNTDDR